MKILIACEESQAICREFRRLGHEAYSCDILPCSGGYPEWHIQGDAILEAYSGRYDMMIAHPPCTYLSNAGARFLYAGGVLNEERFAKGMEAKEFFMKLLNAPIDKIAVENPVQSTIYGTKISSEYTAISFLTSFSKENLSMVKKSFLTPTNQYIRKARKYESSLKLV